MYMCAYTNYKVCMRIIYYPSQQQITLGLRLKIIFSSAVHQFHGNKYITGGTSRMR